MVVQNSLGDPLQTWDVCWAADYDSAHEVGPDGVAALGQAASPSRPASVL